jgi:putative (di)nucleoside polyphosphate hydrolase
MIDEEGYRLNVGMIILNNENKVFWAKRKGHASWQFPQGGVDEGETALGALYRELYEEVGLQAEDVEVPHHFRRTTGPRCIGQKQKWFLLRLNTSSEKLRFDTTDTPEFDQWRFVEYWYPMNKVIAFKRHVYRKALEYFHAHLPEVSASSGAEAQD